MSMIAAAQLTAWATLALASLAVVAAVFAALAWKAQGSQIETLKAQLADQEKVNKEQLPVLKAQVPVLQAQLDELKFARWQHDEDLKELREAHVTRVFLWSELAGSSGLNPAQRAVGLTPSQVRLAYLRNVGEMPVYDVAFSWRVRGGMGYQERLETPLAVWRFPVSTRGRGCRGR
jgi:hypothetical protein